MSNAAGPLHVALIGNPNTGKSTLFNALSGQNVRTGNFPGVTVEAKSTTFTVDGQQIHLTDLPGTYSLSPRSLDEMVAVDVLLGTAANMIAPEVVVCVADAANLERNLYLYTQLLDLNLPFVLVLNMWDNAGRKGIEVDVEKLQASLGVHVVTTVADQGVGIADVKSAILAAKNQSLPQRPNLPAELAAAVSDLRSEFDSPPADFLLLRGLLDINGETEKRLAKLTHDKKFLDALNCHREKLATSGFRIPVAESRWRYDWIREHLKHCVVSTQAGQRTLSDRIDKVLTHRIGGVFVFLLTMLLVFQAIYTFAAPFSDAIGWVQDSASASVESVVPPGILRSLLVDGAIAGVGGVVVFLPQIVFLFLCIGILEDCGYMARAAFLADRLMAPLGLNGRSFVPLMSSFACAVPGIMATRTIENWRDRMVTILIAPLMSCSARWPVYMLLTSAFVPDEYLGGWLSLRALVLFGMHFVGLLFAIPIAWILRKFWFQGESSLFVMEMPDYKTPSWKVVGGRVLEQGREFLVRAGTLIFCTSILVWAAAYFPGDHTRLYEVQTELENIEQNETLIDISQEKIDELVAEHNLLNGELIEASYLGQAGHFIAPAIRPLGWDWKIGVAVIASFPAREVVIAAMGTIYSLGADVDEESSDLKETMKKATWADGRPIFTLPVALSIMVFFALCSQCAATLMVIRRETNSWRWALFTFTYMTLLAYAGAWVTVQVGNWLFV
ncbi:MAG: ferrous iron transport protein B [Planctomycetaceae bacterium]